ncbi:hypothetical protein ASC76_19035 [Rhizobacter sp. Root404]|nr:hypothetical protein ASC76_19035 [Rhizobacter sp. Root404]
MLQVTRLGTRAFIAEFRQANDSKTHVRLGTPATNLDKADPDKLTLAAARSAAQRQLDKLRDSDVRENRQKGADLLQDVFLNYVRAKNIISENSRRYEQVLRMYGGPLWEMPTARITPQAVLDQRDKVANGTFLSWHTAKGSASTARGGPGSANDLVEYGSMVWSWHRPKQPNPFAGIEPFPTGPAREKHVFEPTDLPRIYTAVQRLQADRRTLFWTLLLTGGRPLAVLRMKWSRLNLDDGYYTLTNDKTECAGWKPASSPEWNYPLDNWLLEILREHRMFAPDDAVYLFESNQMKRRGQPMSHTALDTIFNELREQCGLPRTCTPYAARYTRATYCEILFGDTLLTQRMLNHQSDYGKAGQQIRGTRMGATGGYVKTLTEQVRSKCDTYAATMKELCGLLPVSEQTKAIFFENRALTIYERHEYLLQAGSPEVLKEVSGPGRAG